MRHWSVSHSRQLKKIYEVIERLLTRLYPVISKFGYERAEIPVFAVEKTIKGLLLDSQNCGQCIVGSTGMSCPSNCPKLLRNGPCGGVRTDGMCEVLPAMTCVWVLAWQGNKQMTDTEYPIQVVQPAIDNRLRGSSAWLREVRRRAGETGLEI